MTAIDSSFDLFSLTDEHNELRSAIRSRSRCGRPDAARRSGKRAEEAR